MERVLYVTSIVAVLASTTNASARATAMKHGGVCIGPFRGDGSMLQCERVDKVAIEQIYEKDFRVVHMQDDKDTTTYTMLAVEEQR